MKIGWFIACLALFGVDTLLMLFFCGIDLSMLLDYAFHAWILAYLIIGVRESAKLRRMPPEAFAPVPPAEISPDAAPDAFSDNDPLL